MAARQHKLEKNDEGAQAGPERQCAVTRSVQAADKLIRFVASPSGVIVPDLDRRLPGRGVWLSGEKLILERAISGKVFARSLKQPAAAEPDLAERTGALIVKRACDTLALANKAGLVICGFQQVDAALDKAAISVLVHASEAAADGRSKLDRKFGAVQRAGGKPAPVVAFLTIAQMSLALGRASVVHAGLSPGGLTERFLREAERVSRYYALPGTLSTPESPGGDTRIEGEADKA